ncbi:cytochrome-c oxidase [Paenibacillus chibensis]|uniref:Cytochrome-c oxidase n=1 Tax=Paenibacillus chibensis TaxID=59846 RepID=A0ABU6PPL7_9BACL|nr:cytochrome-c oxidase [Paenibacillus chibensis]MEC0372898.1 cytochrome-c oxidase [Paenibacillus chibensis]MED5016324.1 cytochrome-c oxidase [Paenibacillus chibensis]
MGIKLIKIASVYLVIGILFGMFMSITHKFGYASVHAHINLLGWASLALSGIIYYLFPNAGDHLLAKVHFWLHNIGLPVMMIGLILYVNEVAHVEPVIATGGVLVTIGILTFMVNVLQNVKR